TLAMKASPVKRFPARKKPPIRQGGPDGLPTRWRRIVPWLRGHFFLSPAFNHVRRLGPLPDAASDFLAVDSDVGRGGNGKAHLISLGLRDGDRDAAVDDDGFADFPSENQHTSSSMKGDVTSYPHHSTRCAECAPRGADGKRGKLRGKPVKAGKFVA